MMYSHCAIKLGILSSLSLSHVVNPALSEVQGMICQIVMSDNAMLMFLWNKQSLHLELYIDSKLRQDTRSKINNVVNENVT